MKLGSLYKLIHDREMGDGSLISSDEELLLIRENEVGLMFFEAAEGDSKKLFWADKSEVEFLS